MGLIDIKMLFFAKFFLFFILPKGSLGHPGSSPFFSCFWDARSLSDDFLVAGDVQMVLLSCRPLKNRGSWVWVDSSEQGRSVFKTSGVASWSGTQCVTYFVKVSVFFDGTRWQSFRWNECLKTLRKQKKCASFHHPLVATCRWISTFESCRMHKRLGGWCNLHWALEMRLHWNRFLDEVG